MHVKRDQMSIAKKLFNSCFRYIMLMDYVKFGFLDDAVQLFDVMPEKSCVTF